MTPTTKTYDRVRGPEFLSLAHKSAVIAVQNGYSLISGHYGSPTDNTVDVFVAIALRHYCRNDLFYYKQRWEAGQVRKAVKEFTYQQFDGRSIKSWQYNAIKDGIDAESTHPDCWKPRPIGYLPSVENYKEFYLVGVDLSELGKLLSKT